MPDTGVIDDRHDGNRVTSEVRDRRRFDALFDAHRLDIASYCSWRTASRTDAEDAVAEVFLVAWRRIESVPAGDAARAWLYAAARLSWPISAVRGGVAWRSRTASRRSVSSTRHTRPR
jgi:DNA-directed RNA polymerase specialized sigma24 family protein